jgi:TonB family protein
MKNGVKFLVIFLLSIATGCLAHAQQIRFLNTYHYPVYNIEKYGYDYVELTQESGNSKVTQIFTKDSLRIRRTVELFKPDNLKVSRNRMDYFESGKIKSVVIENFENETKETKEYFENGQMKAHIKELKKEITFETYFSEEGKEVDKPIIVLGGPEGGLSRWGEYLSKNLKYPFDARKAGQEGTVYVVFNLGTDGKIIDISIENPEEVSSSLAAEAAQAVRKYPGKWIPTSVDNEYVKTCMRLPVNFKLTD